MPVTLIGNLQHAANLDGRLTLRDRDDDLTARARGAALAGRPALSATTTSVRERIADRSALPGLEGRQITIGAENE